MCNTIQFYSNTIHIILILYIVLGKAVQYRTIQYNSLNCNKIPCITIQYHWIQYNGAFAYCKTRLPNLARGKSSDHYSENCSDVRAVTWFRICPGLAENCRKQLEIGSSRGSKSTSAFCKIHLYNLARAESSNHNSENCSEISAVTWFGIFFRFLKIATFIFFTPP